MKIREIVRKWKDALLMFAAGGIPKESSLETDAKNMLSELDRRADVVSFRMARADEAKGKLQKELENYEALGKQAESYLREGNKAYAQRTVVLQLESKKTIEALQQEYQSLQREAESNAAFFISKRKEVKERVKLLPQLQLDARIVKADKEIAKLSNEFNLDSAKNQFDKTAQEIRIQKLQLANRQLLTSDPNAELDQKIRQSLQNREVEIAMQELAKRIENSGNVVDAEFVSNEDSVLQAKKLLEAPRYNDLGLLPDRSTEAAVVTLK